MQELPHPVSAGMECPSTYNNFDTNAFSSPTSTPFPLTWSMLSSTDYTQREKEQQPFRNVQRFVKEIKKYTGNKLSKISTMIRGLVVAIARK